MQFRLRQYFVALFSCVLTVVFSLPANSFAQSHVVKPADLHKELVNASQARQKNLEKLQQLFSSESAQSALKSTQTSPEQVKAAVSTLSDAELAKLASRADQIQADFAAGRITERDLLLILLGVAVIILIIVAVR
jgi:hypothetical protein